MNELTAIASGVARAGRWAFDMVAMGFGISTPSLSAGQLIDVGIYTSEGAQSVRSEKLAPDTQGGLVDDDDRWINPATGLPMLTATADVAGNLVGTACSDIAFDDDWLN